MDYINEQIYVSGPWSFASGVLQVVKSIKVKSRADKVVYSEKGTEYQFSKLEQSDYVVFVLDGFAWQQKLESISKGMLSELMWCVNHRVPMFLAYKSANGLGIYSTEIDENLNFKGIAGVLKVNNDGGYTIQDEGVYLKGELLGDPLDFLNVEQPKSYFY